jgi:hypothetical protein
MMRSSGCDKRLLFFNSLAECRAASHSALFGSNCGRDYDTAAAAAE